MRLEPRGGLGVLGAADHHDPPAVIEEPADQRPPVRGAASAWPRSPRRGGPPAAAPRPRTARRAARRARPGAIAPEGAGRVVARPPIGDLPPRKATAPRPAAGRSGQASRSRWPTRTRSRSVGVHDYRRGAVGRQAQPFEQGQPRDDLVPAGDPVGDVGQQEPAPAHRPADPPRDARQRQDAAPSGCRPGRRSPGRSRSPRSDRPSSQTAEPSAHRPRPRSNQFRAARRTRSTCGSASKTSRLLGEASTSIVAPG